VLFILPHRTPLNELMAQTKASGISFNLILSVCELPNFGCFFDVFMAVGGLGFELVTL